ncbi:cell division protein FtsA [Elusimicrobium posterum]
MAKTNIIAGLDIGSGKVTCVAAAQDFETNTLKVEAAGSLSCRGLRGGVVLDIRETSSAVLQLLTSIEKDCGADIGSLFVGVRGSHLESFTNHGTYNISRMDKEITIADMQLAIENAKAIPIKNDNEIVNVIPRVFQ